MFLSVFFVCLFVMLPLFSRPWGMAPRHLDLQNTKKGSLIRGFTLAQWPDGYAILLSPNKGEIAVHGCHCRGDMVVCMRKVLTYRGVGTRALVHNLFVLERF